MTYKTILSSVFLVATALSFSFTPVYGQQKDMQDLDSMYNLVAANDISIAPCEKEIDPNLSQSRAWIIKKAKAGDTIDTCVMVANPTEETKTIKLAPRDAEPTNDGAFGMSSDKTELSNYAKWIDMQGAPDTLELSAGKYQEFDIKINVPGDAEAGEYASAISIMEIEGEEATGNFKILKRYGNRIYITVEPEDQLNMGTEFSTFEFIVPGSQMYEQYAKKARGYKWDDITMTWDFNMSGNIFTKTKGKLIITTPSGENFETEKSTDYFPGDELFVPYIPSDAKWTNPGKYKARFEFDHEPTVPWNKPENIENISSVKFVETEIDIDQETLDKLKADKDTLGSLLNEEEKVEAEEVKTNTVQGFDGEMEGEGEEKMDGEKEESDNTLMYIIAGTGGVVILALLAIIAFLALKKNKSNEKEEKKEVEAKQAEVIPDQSSANSENKTTNSQN